MSSIAIAISISTLLERELKFRTADGRCNNLEETNYGRAGTPLQRILDPSYGGSYGDF